MYSTNVTNLTTKAARKCPPLLSFLVCLNIKHINKVKKVSWENSTRISVVNRKSTRSAIYSEYILPHHLIKKKLCELIQWTFGRENKLYVACSDYRTFFTSDQVPNCTTWSCETVCDALCFLIDNIFIRNGHTIYRQVIGIPMGTNCAPLIADLFLYCYERDFMKNLWSNSQTDVILAFNNTCRYLDDILNVDNHYFEQYKSLIYPKELTLVKSNTNDQDAPFLDLRLWYMVTLCQLKFMTRGKTLIFPS